MALAWELVTFNIFPHARTPDAELTQQYYFSSRFWRISQLLIRNERR